MLALTWTNEDGIGGQGLNLLGDGEVLVGGSFEQLEVAGHLGYVRIITAPDSHSLYPVQAS